MKNLSQTTQLDTTIPLDIDFEMLQSAVASLIFALMSQDESFKEATNLPLEAGVVLFGGITVTYALFRKQILKVLLGDNASNKS